MKDIDAIWSYFTELQWHRNWLSTFKGLIGKKEKDKKYNKKYKHK